MERSRNNDFRIDNFSVERRVIAVFVIGYDICVAMGFEPFSEPELVFNCSEQSRLFLCPFTASVKNCDDLDLHAMSVAFLNWTKAHHFELWRSFQVIWLALMGEGGYRFVIMRYSIDDKKD